MTIHPKRHVGSRKRAAVRVLTLTSLLFMAACAQLPGIAPSQSAKNAASGEPEDQSGNGAAAPAPGQRDAPHAAEPKAAAAKPVAAKPASAPAPAPVAAPPVDAAKSIASALEMLQDGQDAAALVELNRVLAADAGNRAAQALVRQIEDDPQVALGRESFNYKVSSGETLSHLAQRFLGDPQLFYILARYNSIKVPRTLGEGQVLRIPGKAPAAEPASAAANAAATADRKAAAPIPPDQKATAIATLTRQARSAFAKQDLAAAITSWDAVLQLDPDNRTAFLERARVLSLQEKLKKLK